MFGWFAPKCPVSLFEKTWTEWRFRWLLDKLGWKRLLAANVLLPTDESIAGPYTGNKGDARRLMKTLAQHMGVNASRIDLRVVRDMPGAAGQYEPDADRIIIRVSASQLADLQHLLATLAHELSHEILLGGELLTPETPDHEWITDLTMVYLGVGIFAANATLVENSGYNGGWSWWWSKQGYMPAHLFGYAMALFCFLRQEEPSWAEHLRPDAAAALHQGWRFLHKTKDVLIQPDSLDSGRFSCTSTGKIAYLTEGSPTVRLANLWEIGEQTRIDPALEPALQKCLLDPNEEIVAEALRLLARLGIPPAWRGNRLIHLLCHGSPVLQAAAAFALGSLQPDPPTDVQFLGDLLQERNPLVLQEVCQALCKYGSAAASMVPKILVALPIAFREGDQPGLDNLLRILLHVLPNEKKFLVQAYGGGDQEMLEHFFATYEDQDRLLKMEGD